MYKNVQCTKIKCNAVGDADFTDVDVAAIAGLLKLFLVSISAYTIIECSIVYYYIYRGSCLHQSYLLTLRLKWWTFNRVRIEIFFA